MNSNDPIRMADFAARPAAGAFTPGHVSRMEAGRQFRFSLVLVVTLVTATFAVATTMPGADASKQSPQIAHNGNVSDLTYTVVR